MLSDVSREDCGETKGSHESTTSRIYMISMLISMFGIGVLISFTVFLRLEVNSAQYLEKIDSLQKELDAIQGPEVVNEDGLGRGGYDDVSTSNANSGTESDYPLMFPIHEDDLYRYTSEFGKRVSPFSKVELLADHRGLDMVSIRGVYRSQVVAAEDGIVTEHYPPPGTRRDGITYRGHDIYGGMIKITHDDGVVTLYAHLDSTYVRTNQRVARGDRIGRMGSTGMSTGEHLHFEVIVDGIHRNPLHYIPDVMKYRQQGIRVSSN